MRPVLTFTLSLTYDSPDLHTHVLRTRNNLI